MYYHIIKFVKFTHDIKVRLQTMPPIKPGETPLYKGTFDCAMQTIRKEVGWTFNIMDLWKKKSLILFALTIYFYNITQALKNFGHSSHLSKICLFMFEEMSVLKNRCSSVAGFLWFIQRNVRPCRWGHTYVCCVFLRIWCR